MLTMTKTGIAFRAVTAGLVTGMVLMTLPACSAGGLSSQATLMTTADGSATSSGTAGESVTRTQGVALRGEADIPVDGSPLMLLGDDGTQGETDGNSPWDEASATVVELSGAGAQVRGTDSGVSVSDGAITISDSGTYVIRGEGTCPIVIDDSDREDAQVRLVLDGASISVDGYACIYAKSADKVCLTLADGSRNALSTEGEISQRDDHSVDGVVFARCDLSVNGTGSCDISGGESVHGIACKDDLALIDGTVSVTVPSRHAIQAEGSVTVRGGRWILTAGKDGIHAEHDEDATKGWVHIAGGTLSIKSGSDGMDSGSWVQIDDGNISIDSADDAVHSELDLAVNGGTISITGSQEGLEGGTVTITSGDVSIKSEDDGINAAGDGTGATEIQDMPDGTNRISTGNQLPSPGMGEPSNQGRPPEPPENQSSDVTGRQGHPEAGGRQGGADPRQQDAMPISDGQAADTPDAGPLLPEMPPHDGQDGDGDRSFPEAGHVPEGNPRISVDREMTDGDGTMAPNGTGDGEWRQGAPGMMGTDTSAIITISGGTISIDAYGDGLDSNGLIQITGGSTTISGPVNDGNSAIDYGSALRTDGGTLVAAGSSGMVEGISDQSSQPSIIVFLDGAISGDISVSSDEGDTLATLRVTKGYSCVIVSCPQMEVGKSYRVTTGDESRDVELTGMVTEIGTSRSIMAGMGIEEGFLNSSDLVGMRLGTSPQG